MGNAGAKCVRCLARASCHTCCDPELEAGVKGKDFSLDGQRFRAKAVDVYDGDTIRVQFRLSGTLYQMKARMAGYDSPEMKPSRSAPHREEEKKAAIAARDALYERIGGQMIYIHCGGFDKYGRLLVTVRKPCGFLGLKDGFNINQWMVAEKHGVPYDGGTKKPFVSEEHEHEHEHAEHEHAEHEHAEREEARSSDHAIVNPKAHAARVSATSAAEKPPIIGAVDHPPEPAKNCERPLILRLQAPSVRVERPSGGANGQC